MRLHRLRALPRGLWGGTGVPELCRSLCQRPARVPSQGGDTAGTPKPRGSQQRDPDPRGDTPRGDTPRGDTPRGDTSGASAWWHRHKIHGERDPDGPRGSGGGDTFGGDTLRDGTFRGDTSGGDTLRDGTFRGDTSGGDTLRDGAFRGDTSKDGTFRGDTFRDGSFRGDTFGGGTFRGDTSRDDTFRHDTSGGDTSKDGTFRGDPSAGDTPEPPPRRLLRRRSAARHDRGDRGDPDDPAGWRAALRSLSLSPPGRGGRLALVEAALAALPALGAERSLGAYNALLRLLPRGLWVPRGPLQRLLFPFPRQQECGLRLLEQMERYGVMPDAETRFLLLGVFGPRSRPVRKVQRMLFWLPRLRHLDPHPLPPRLPPGLAAARLGLRRITGDPAATVTVLQHPVPDSGQDEGSVQPYILSSQSPEQRELLARHDPARPVFVEGPFPLWLRGTLLKYFVLRGDPLPPHLRDPPPDPERSFYFPLHLELDLERGPWDKEDFDVDEVEEGPVFALAMVGVADRLTLARWISGLQRHNPVLGRAPVVFRLGDPPESPQTPRLGTGTPPAAAAEPPEGGGTGGDPPKNE